MTEPTPQDKLHFIQQVDAAIMARMEKLFPHLIGKSSEDTINKFKKMDEKLQGIENNVSNIEKDVSTIKEDIKKMPTKEGMALANKELVEEVMGKSDKKYASKRAEIVVYGMVGIVLIYVIQQWLHLI